MKTTTKKKLIAGTVSVLMSMVLLTGCDMLAPNGNIGDNGGETGDPAGKTALEVVEEKYARLGEAQTIEQTIGIVQDTLTQYESEKTYTKAGSGYRVTGSIKRLNSLASGASEAYTTETVETTLKAGEFAVKLELDELYFSTAPTYENGVMEVTVSDNSVETVFGLVEELPLTARPHGLKLKIATDDKHVTWMEIAYTSKSSAVSIALRFGY